MPQQVYTSMARLLNGQGLEEEEYGICDFTIADQNSVAESQGITPTTPSNFKPILGTNITYVVACVILNEINEVLMIQEAKESCAGKWYLPAGRMEKGESIVQAVTREVLEETGLECTVTSLLVAETAAGMWYRFVLTAEVVGGDLKTPAKADKESLQAKWISNFDEITLRSNDILPIIEKAKSFKLDKSSGAWHDDILPAQISHVKNLLRLIIVIKKRSTNKLHVLLSEKSAIHYPICEINPAKSIHSTLRRFMVEMFGADVGQHRPLGLLNLEHCPPTDGCCLTLLVAFRAPLEEVPLIGKCVWQELPKDIETRLLSTITTKNSLIELNVVR